MNIRISKVLEVLEYSQHSPSLLDESTLFSWSASVGPAKPDPHNIGLGNKHCLQVMP